MGEGALDDSSFLENYTKVVKVCPSSRKWENVLRHRVAFFMYDKMEGTTPVEEIRKNNNKFSVNNATIIYEFRVFRQLTTRKSEKIRRFSLRKMCSRNSGFDERAPKCGVWVPSDSSGDIAGLHFASPPQSGLGYRAWVEKFVFNLCFKVPEFVLLPTLRDKLISLGAEEVLAPK